MALAVVSVGTACLLVLLDSSRQLFARVLAVFRTEPGSANEAAALVALATVLVDRGLRLQASPASLSFAVLAWACEVIALAAATGSFSVATQLEEACAALCERDCDCSCVPSVLPTSPATERITQTSGFALSIA